MQIPTLNPQSTSSQRLPFMKKIQEKGMCHVWDSHSPAELCAVNRWQRLKKMRELSMFMRCPEDFSNLQLIDMFQLDWRQLRTEEDLISHSEHLRPGVDGQSCILSDANLAECNACFNKLHNAQKKLEKTLWSFLNLLQRFDCRLVNKKYPTGLSTTRPFSPNTTCQNCAEWYRKWLLVNLVGIWKKKHCNNWCYYTQLACPHLATSKVVEFAGHPSFLCHRDQRISSTNDQLDCSCLHPCDLIQDRNSIAQIRSDNKTNLKMDINREDEQFFHVSNYCRNRKQQCLEQQDE